MKRWGIVAVLFAVACSETVSGTNGDDEEGMGDGDGDGDVIGDGDGDGDVIGDGDGDGDGDGGAPGDGDGDGSGGTSTGGQAMGGASTGGSEMALGGLGGDVVTPPKKRIFVTSRTYDGNFGGVSGAHSECQARAAAADLGGAWSAVISIKATSAKERLANITGPWYRLDGELVFANKAEMEVGPQVSITVDENGDEIVDQFVVWTGTGSQMKTIDLKVCNAWKAGGLAYLGAYGNAGRLDTGWIHTGDQTCNNLNRLYCIEH